MRGRAGRCRGTGGSRSLERQRKAVRGGEPCGGDRGRGAAGVGAADVDGGSWLQVFWGVTLPQLRPIIAITLILATIGSMNTFDVVLALTAGGPGRATEVLSLLAYNTLFVDFDYSRASVMGLAMLCLSLAFTALYMKYLNADSA